MGRTGERFILFLFAVFLLSYTGYQINRYIHAPYTTEPAMTYSTADSVFANGVVIRDEEVINGRVNGVISYLCDDGTKVTDTTPIGEVYANEKDVHLQKQIRMLDEEIRLLRLAGDKVAAEYTNAETLSRQITASMSKLVNATSNGLVENLNDTAAQLTLLLNRNQVVTGAEESFDSRLVKLATQRADLAAQLTGNFTEFSSPVTGYFVRTVDGYEEQLTPQTMETLTVAQLKEFSQKKVLNSDEKIGKIIRDQNWYYAALIPQEEMDKFRVGEKVTLSFNLFNLNDIPFYVQEIRTDESSSECAVILRSNYVLPELASVRTSSAEIVFKAYSGLRVPASAKRYEGLTPGVFVLENDIIRFKTINIVYENEDYILCGTDPTDGRPLKLFDQVIVEGSDLRDGKSVK